MDYKVWQQDDKYLIWLSAVSSSPADVQVFDINIQVPKFGKYWVTCEQLGGSIGNRTIWLWDVCPTRERNLLVSSDQQVSEWTSWYVYDQSGNDVSKLYARLAYFTYTRDQLVGGEQLCNHDWNDQSKQFAVIDDGNVISTSYQGREVTPYSLLNVSW